MFALKNEKSINSEDFAHFPPHFNFHPMQYGFGRPSSSLRAHKAKQPSEKCTQGLCGTDSVQTFQKIFVIFSDVTRHIGGKEEMQ